MLCEGLEMRKIAGYQDVKKSTNQGTQFYGLSWSYPGSKSNLHFCTKMSAMATLTPKSSIENRNINKDKTVSVNAFDRII